MTSSHQTTLETLLEQRDWLHGLARRLVLDPTQADDLVQETWLETLKRPPEHAGDPRAWLGTVTRRVFTRRFRPRVVFCDLHEGDVPSREAVPPDVLERAQLHRQLVDAVLALDEPYRCTVLARWFDGEAPTEIARRQNVSLHTVKTRLQRGLTKLRTRLDRSHGNDGSWRAAFLPLARLALPTRTTKVTWMMTCMLLMAGWFGLTLLNPGAVESERLLSPRLDPSLLERAVVLDEVVGVVRRNEVESPSELAATRTATTLIVTTWGTNVPRPDARVRVLTRDLALESLRLQSQLPLHVGTLRLDEWTDRIGEVLGPTRENTFALPEGTVYVMAETDALWWGSAVRDDIDVMRLELRPKKRFEIRVLDHEGHGAGDVPVRVQVAAADQVLHRSLWETVTDERGSAISDRVHLIAAQVAPERELVAQVELPGGAPIAAPVTADTAVVRLQLPRTAPWRIVPYEGMRPMPRSALEIEVLPTGGQHAFPAFENVARRTFGEEGAFFPHVPLGVTWRLRVVTMTGRENHVEVGPTDAGREFVTRLTRPPTPFVSVTFVDEAGAPLSDWDVAILTEVKRGSQSASGMQRSRTDAEGTLRFSVPPEVTPDAVFALDAVLTRKDAPERLYEFVGGTIDVPVAGEIALGTRRLEPSPPVLAGRLLMANDKPLPGIVLFIEDVSGPIPSSRVKVTTDKEGRFAWYAPRRTLFAATTRKYRVSVPGGLRVPPVDVAFGDVEIVMRLEK
ncbi:MAG: sigma-70 family RNA polymerase sigma factor [Planctomycetes bacterium]|nr:sigma-70 family RNA polymerase sigma factor [Planctomycetota bacterium]